MVAKTVVAAIAALFTVISVPASAQTQPLLPGPPQPLLPGPPQPLLPGPPEPLLPGPQRPRNPPPAQGLQQPIYPQFVYPQFVYPPFVGLCVVPDVGTCEVFRAPGSYCECKNWIGEVFSGIVQ